MTNWQERVVIRQQIVLNDRMFERGHITRQMHERARRVLVERLAGVDGVGKKAV